jgi:hypothetical protein
MPNFYHIQKASAATFRVGKTYAFGQERNHHMQRLLAEDVRVNIAGVGPMTLDVVIKDYLDPATLNYYRTIRQKGYTGGEKGLLAGAAHVIDQQARLLRELLFEQVRLDSFPQKPSRLTSIWLIPQREDVLDQWCATVPPSQEYRVFELAAEGNFHFGAGKYLRVGNACTETLLDNARRYWSESVDLNEPTASIEILLSGTVTVQRELKNKSTKKSLLASLARKFTLR